MSWCTIESDPGVFSELISEFGVSGVQVEELYSLDEDSMARLGTVHGLVFLFKWRQEKDDRPYLGTDEQGSLFFASQVIQNACATQAILSILLNRPEIDLGEELTNFKAFTKEFPPELKGLAVANAEPIRKAHNSFARPEPFVAEEGRKTDKSDEDLYHFISYVPVGGRLYELDGLKQGPIMLGECSTDNWLQVVTPLIQKRIEQYSSKEIRFNLMAVVADRRVKLTQQQALIEKERNMTVGKLQARGGKMPTPAELHEMATVHPEPPPTGEVAVDERTVEQLTVALAHTTRRSQQVQREIDQENQKVQQWKVENRRRKHNYVPFIVGFLRVLAERGELMPMLEAAKRRKTR